jgi:hypothetical protein
MVVRSGGSPFFSRGVPAMGIRLIVLLAVLTAVPAAKAQDGGPRIDSRVHDAGICWDPDIEYPIACDDDDD